MITYIDLLKKIHELLNCNLTDDFLKRVGVLLKEYENLIKSGVSYSNANKTFRLEAGDILVNVKKTSNLIPQILKSYLNGHVVESVLSLQNFIKESNFYNVKLDPNYVYYRARVSENILRTREDMFHVPYTNRGNVTNKRYSISGHPCLYLGRSVYICWEELRRPHIENIYISAFKTKNKINVLDLRMYKQFYFQAAFKSYLELFPIILICSMPTCNDRDTYKPEYILPQLLLHTAAYVDLSEGGSRKCLDKIYRGVIYSSTHIDFETGFLSESKDFCLTDCIVIPARNATPRKYCSYLTSRFELTEPVNFGVEILCNKDKILNKKDDLIKDKEKHFNYQMSFFAPIEGILDRKKYLSL